MYTAQCTFLGAVLLTIVTLSSAQYTFEDKTAAIRWSRLDIDVKEAEEGFDDAKYPSVRRIYTSGKFAKPRTLKKLSTTAGVAMRREPTFQLYRSYWKSPRYADRTIIQIISRRGPYARQSQKFRADAGIKTIQYQSIWMWVIHQMEVAISACKNRRKAGAVNGWDRAVADYMGSQIVASEENAGYSLHTLAVKRCGQFGTCTTANGVTKAKVNFKVYFNFARGKVALKAGKCGVANVRKNNIIRLMYVPIVQGCVRYIVKTKIDTGEDKQKSHAEAWAFCAAFLPKLDSCNKRAAQIIRQQLGPQVTNPMSAAVDFVLKAVYDQFSCMGIRCVDYGNYDEYPNIRKC